MGIEATRAFEEHRSLLTGLAYRMLGSVADAEDVVQDTYLRWHRTDRDSVQNPRAFLSTVVTRLCLDRLKEARHRRESYVGTWLPEPLLAERATQDTPAEELAVDASVALMLALERLSPLERAAFLLHDVFDMNFSEVAASLDRDVATCRKLASRARIHVREARPRFEVDQAESTRVAEAFFAATRSGDSSRLRELLAEDAVLSSDGGGKKAAVLRPIVGGEKINRFLTGLAKKIAHAMPRWHRAMLINGLPGWVSVEPDGTLQTTALEIIDGKVAAIYITRNPDKLRHLARWVPEGL
jgi:RNA polymerase sigma-70 factor (ECF subfamily)